MKQTRKTTEGKRGTGCGFLHRVTSLMLLLFVLAGCGGGKPGVKDFAGYYTLNRHRQDLPNLAISISSKGEVVYMREYMSGLKKKNCTQRGTLEINEEGEAEIWLSEEYYNGKIETASSGKYCPLYLKISEDGKTAYLTSDSPDWETDVYQVVDEEAFTRFVDEESDRMITWDGSTYQTYDDRHPEAAAQKEQEKAAAEAERQAEREREELAGWIVELYFMYSESKEQSEEEAEENVGDYYGYGPAGQVFANHFKEIDAVLSGTEIGDVEGAYELLLSGPVDQWMEEFRALQ